MASPGCRWRIAGKLGLSTSVKIAILAVLLLGVTGGIWLELRRMAEVDQISYSQFLRDLDGDQLDRLDIHGLSVSGHYKDGKPFHAELPYLDPQLADDIAEHSEAFFQERESVWQSILMFGVPALVIGLVLGWMMQRRDGSSAALGS
jgi:cell division protease FtsH